VKAKSFERVLTAAALAVTCILGAACGSKIEGTYTSPSGVLTLDLRSGGRAQVTLYSESRDHDDGSLRGPFTMGILRKSK
jgi:hypothetical protein